MDPGSPGFGPRGVRGPDALSRAHRALARTGVWGFCFARAFAHTRPYARVRTFTFARAFARIDALLEDEGALDEHQRALIDAYERFEVAWRVSLADGLEAVGRARTARAGAG